MAWLQRGLWSDLPGTRGEDNLVRPARAQSQALLFGEQGEDWPARYAHLGALLLPGGAPATAPHPRGATEAKTAREARRGNPPLSSPFAWARLSPPGSQHHICLAQGRELGPLAGVSAPSVHHH